MSKPDVANEDRYFLDHVGVRRFVAAGDPLPPNVTEDDLEKSAGAAPVRSGGRRKRPTEGDE